MTNNETIKVIDPIEHVRSNPRMYWGVDEPTADVVNSAILEQYEAENCKSIVVEEISGWQVISTETNWVKGLVDDEKQANEIFLDAKGFPGGGGNGLRFEALLHIMVDDLSISIDGNLIVVKGNMDEAMKEKVRKISINKVTIAYSGTCFKK